MKKLILFPCLLIAVAALAQIVPSGGGSVSSNSGNATNMNVYNKLTLIGSSPQFVISNSAAATHEKKWTWLSGGSGVLDLVAQSDSGSSNSIVAAQFSREGSRPTLAEWFLPTNIFYGDVYVTGSLLSSNFTGTSKALKSTTGKLVAESTASGDDLDNIAGLTGNVQGQFSTKANITNATHYGPVTVNNGDILVSDSSGTNHVSINSSYNADAILNVQNHSTANDQKTINAVSTLTLDRTVTGEWSAGHFGYHIHQNGFDWNGIMFPNDSSYNMDGIGNISTLYTHQFSATLGSSWNGRGTNMFMLHSRLSYDSTNASVLKDLRGLNFSWTRGGNSTAEKEQYIVLPDFVIPFSTHAAGIYSLINPAAGVTFINDQGGASNYWSGDHRFDGTEYLRNGSASSPAIAFLNSPTTGFYRRSDGSIAPTFLGTNFFYWTALGVLTPTNTDALDLGTSLLEFRNVYASNFTAAVVTGIGRLAIGSSPATNLNTLIGLDYNKLIGWRRTDNSADGAWIGYTNGFFQIFTSTGSGTEPTLKQVITATAITNSVATTINGALTVAGGITTTSSGAITSADDVSVAAAADLRFLTKTRLASMGGATNRMHLRDINAVSIAELKARPVAVMTSISANYTNNYTNHWVKITSTLTNTFCSAADSGEVEGSTVEISVEPRVTATLRPFAAANQTIAGRTTDYIVTGPWGGTFHSDHLTNWVLMSSSWQRVAVSANTSLTVPGYYVSTVTITNTLPVASSVAPGAKFELKSKNGITTTVRPGNGTDTIDQGVAGADDSLTSLQHKVYVSDGASNWEIN